MIPLDGYTGQSIDPLEGRLKNKGRKSRGLGGEGERWAWRWRTVIVLSLVALFLP